ncbi:acyltransferase [Leucobacter sp. OH1287]|uniref:acyltransferase family protein n=1 Tax=Leucobacter sp. OH1287 TaxID=2491049 RepID=UPI000F5F0BA1|nr:acyltransferase [Leucobacter sp. OH1287]RRD61132.1 acyltransferase [Leucobacter sp. OH1287]
MTLAHTTTERRLSIFVSPRPRLDSLTGLRWWAAFGVFLFHMGVLAELPGVSGLANYGYMGVAFFFVLSGFVIAWSHRDSTSAPTFYWRRFGRIYPAHFVALLIALPVFYSANPDASADWVKPYDWGILSLSIPLLQGWSNDPVVLFSGNPAAWTLTAEFFFYAITPLLFVAMRGLRARGAAVLAVVSAAAIVTYPIGKLKAPELFDMIPPPVARVSEYTLGVALALLLMSGVRVKVPPLLVGSAIAAVVVAQVFVAPRFPDIYLIAVFSKLIVPILVLLFALLIYSVALRDIRGGFSSYRNRVLVKLGEVSFAFYLVHATVLYTFLAIFGYQGSSWRNLGWYAVTFVVALALAWLLHSFVEKPCERVIRGWRSRHDAAKAAKSAGADPAPAPVAADPAAKAANPAGGAR